MRVAIGPVLFFVQIPIIVTDVSVVKYTKTHHMNTKFVSAIRKLETSSLMSCTTMCDQTDTCVAVSFSSQGICELSQYKPADKHAKTIQQDGWKIYVKHAGAISYIFGCMKDDYDYNFVRVYVVSSHPTTVTLTSPLTDYRHETKVINGTEIVLPNSLRVPRGNGIVPYGMTLESNTPVDVYVENMITLNTISSGSFIIPTSHLSTEYILLSIYDTFSVKAQFFVVGTVDNTSLNIVFNNGNETALELNRYEMYRHEEVEDLTGTLITSSENIAVFVDIQCMQLMHQFCDNMYEQMPPIRELQKEFIVSYPYPNNDYALRLMAVENNTEISLSVGISVVLNRLEVKVYEINGETIAITASKQIMVAVHYVGSYVFPRVFFSESMLIVPGLSQFKSKYNIFVPKDINQCFLMITFPAYLAPISRIRLNHKPMVADEKTSVTATGRGQYTILFKELPKGISVIYTADETPFGVYISLVRSGTYTETQSWFSLSYFDV